MMKLTKLGLFLGIVISISLSAQQTNGAELVWTDLSAQIPTTTLDQNTAYPLLSFSSSRGHEWLAGNPNQLFQVTSKEKIFDLTPDLKKFGFEKIRQVASDGSHWLVIGDSGPWFNQPDLAFKYDGMYWHNVSFIMTALPPQEWIGRIAGKKNLWLLPTGKSLYVWHSSLNSLLKMNLPPELTGYGQIDFKFYSVENGWLVRTVNRNGQNYYLFDGQNFKNINQSLRAGQTSCIASNGSAIIVLETSSEIEDVKNLQATYYDGYKFQILDRLIKPLVQNTEGSWDERNSHIVWDGKNWLLFNHDRRMAEFNGRQPLHFLSDTKDYFINSGYGTAGSTLHVGYVISQEGTMTPRLVMTSQK